MSLFAFEEPVQEAPAGLVYRPQFLSLQEELDLIGFIDLQPWELELKRRRQFYGQSYISGNEYGEVPPILKNLAKKLYEAGLVHSVPDQVLINEYFPGQGIAAHVDYSATANSQVVTVSLLDTYPMQFAHVQSGEVYEKWLERRSVCVMSGPSRHDWTHEILKRKADPVEGGGRRLRLRRVSVTYRTY